MMSENQKRLVEPMDLFRLNFIAQAQVSPSGKTAVYALQTTDPVKEEDYSSLWLLNLESGEAHPLTSGAYRDSAASFSPDGASIAFLSNRAGAPQIFIIPAQGGEPRQLTSLKQPVGGAPVWSPDGQTIAFTAASVEERPDPNKPYRVTRTVYRYNSFGYLDAAVQGIFLVPSSGGEPRRLTDDRCSYMGLAWSPNGQELLCLQFMRPDTHLVVHPVLKRLNLEGKMTDVVGDWGVVFAAAWLPDGEGIAFVGQPWGRHPGCKFDLWVTNRQGKTPECRTAGLAVGVRAELMADFYDLHGPMIFLSPGGKEAYCMALERGSIRICRCALAGEEHWQMLAGGERTYQLVGVSSQGLCYGVSDLQKPYDLFTSALDGSREKQVTAVNQEILSTWLQPKVEHLVFESVGGVSVEGWMLLPPQGQAPYPTILYNHGGPHLAFGYIYSFDFHMLAAAGYAVLFINYRGSTGYGDDFVTAILEDLGNLDYQDLMTGLDIVITRGIADPDRLGCCGLSYGGYLSCWIVGHTDRFKAAVPENPVTNWLSMYGTSDSGRWFAEAEMGDAPYDVPEVYARCSPITYAHRCTTPTLLIQGEADYRCPAEQSEQFYTVLKANGCVVEMLRLPNSSHMGTIYGPPVLRKAQNDALLEWMNRYVLGK